MNQDNPEPKTQEASPYLKKYLLKFFGKTASHIKTLEDFKNYKNEENLPKDLMFLIPHNIENDPTTNYLRLFKDCFELGVSLNNYQYHVLFFMLAAKHPDITLLCLDNGLDPHDIAKVYKKSLFNLVNATILYPTSNPQKIPDKIKLLNLLEKEGFLNIHWKTRKEANNGTLLHVAKEPEVVAWLISKGVKLNTPNDLGQTALEYHHQQPQTQAVYRYLKSIATLKEHQKIMKQVENKIIQKTNNKKLVL